MEHLFEPVTDQFLYHYTTAQGAGAILQCNSLRLSEFSMMNDKSEYTYAKSKFIEAYQNRGVWIEEVPRWMANIKLNTLELATTMMIGCLSEDGDDAGLWDRYADQGKGCVLCLDAAWLTERAGVAIKRVSYDTEDIHDFVNSGLMMLQDEYEQNPNDHDELANLASMFVLDLYAFKDPRFRSEKEVRISRITFTDKAKLHGLVDLGGHRSDGSELPELPIKRRNGRYGPTRFVELPLFDEELASAIRAIGFGPRIEVKNRAMIMQTMRKYPDINSWKSDLPLR